MVEVKNEKNVIGVAYGKDGKEFYVQTFCGNEHDIKSSECGCSEIATFKDMQSSKELAEKISNCFDITLENW